MEKLQYGTVDLFLDTLFSESACNEMGFLRDAENIKKDIGLRWIKKVFHYLNYNFKGKS